MKTDKWRLFSGILLLTTGIVLKATTSLYYPALILIFSGVGFKIWHVSYLIVQKKYKPGKEFWFLFLGLLMFFSGLYFIEVSYLKYTLMTIGVLFKSWFVFQLIRKSRGVKPGSK